MDKFEARVNSWRTTKQNIPVSDVITIINHYFPNCKEAEGTSHRFKIQHNKLKDQSGFFQGCLTLPISHGKQIKPIYIKKLVKAIDIITE